MAVAGRGSRTVLFSCENIPVSRTSFNTSRWDIWFGVDQLCHNQEVTGYLDPSVCTGTRPDPALSPAVVDELCAF
jgi:hypothetical protein